MAVRWTANQIREWKQIGRDILAYALAAFLVIYGTLNAVELGVSLVAAFFGTATVFLGLPHVLRIDRDKDEEH